MKPRSRLFYFFLFAFSFLLYFRTLAPGLLDGDSAEFQMAAWNFSLVHPTGYPLYLLLGGVWSHLMPFGDPAYRMNLFSAFAAALAVAFLGAAIHTATRSRIGAFVGASAFALSPLFWNQATETEVYALNSLWLALLVWLILKWREDKRMRFFLLACFVFGLALAHHRSIILLAPAFALFVIWQMRTKVAPSPSSTDNASSPSPTFSLSYAFALALILLPLLLYLFIPLRLPNTPYATLDLSSSEQIVTFDSSAVGLTRYVLGQRFENELGWRAASADRLLGTGNLVVEQFNPLLVLVAVLGIAVRAWRKDGSLLALALLGAGAVVFFNALYFIGDIRDFYTPFYFFIALFIGIGAAALVELFAYVAPPRLRAFAPSRLLASVLLLLIPFFTLVNTFNARDRSNQVSIRANWNRVLALPLGDRAIIVSNDRDEMIPMWYLQYVENQQRDWLGLFPLITPAPEYANVVRVIDSAMGSGRPVYVNKPMPGLEVRFPIDPSAPLPRILARAYSPPANSSNVLLGDSLQAVGFALEQDSARAKSYRVRVYWRVVRAPARDYTSYLHLLDSQDNKVLQGNDHRVGGDFYPTSQWQVGETLRDTFTFETPGDFKAGTYRILVGMYTQPDLEQIGEPVEIGAMLIGE